jgi:ribonuclease D
MLKKEITKEEINQLPLFTYEQQIVITRDEKAIDKVMKDISKSTIVGFDTESKPVYKRGQFNRVSLMQLALPDVVYLLRLQKTGLTDSLIQLMENDRIIKVGIAIDDDLMALKKRRSFNPAGFKDLNKIASDAGFLSIGAKKLTAMILGKRISKRQQRSNWENPKLSEQQIAYAATDAWICQAIYLRFMEDGIV